MWEQVLGGGLVVTEPFVEDLSGGGFELRERGMSIHLDIYNQMLQPGLL